MNLQLNYELLMGRRALRYKCAEIAPLKVA